MRSTRFVLLCLLLLLPGVGWADSVELTQQEWNSFSGATSFTYNPTEDYNEIYCTISASGAAGDFSATLSETQPADGNEVTLSVELTDYQYDDDAGAQDLVAAAVEVIGIAADANEAVLMSFDVVMDVPYAAIAVDSLTGDIIDKMTWSEVPAEGQAMVIAMAPIAPGFVFTGWTGNAVDLDCAPYSGTTEAWLNPYKYYVTEAQTLQCYLTANYTVAEDRTLSIDSTDGGSVTEPNEGDFTYPETSVVDIEATADPNYVFDGWTGTAVDAGDVADPNAAATTVTVNGDYTLTANFLPIYTLDVSSSDGGSAATPGEGDFDYISGADVAIEATADPNWMFAGWTGTAVDEGKVADANEPSTSVTVDGDYTLVANFTQVFSVAVSSSAGGVVTAPGEGTIEYGAGSSVAIQATPDADFVFVGWTGTAVDEGMVSDASSATATLTITGDCTLMANFLPVYTLSVSSGDGGSATTPGEGAFDYTSGTSVAIAATAETGYKFSGWSGSAVTAGKVDDAGAATTTVIVEGDYTLVANFTPVYSLDLSSTAGGSVTAPGEGTFEYTSGTSAAIAAAADTGYEFTGWTGTAVDAGMVADVSAQSTTVTMDDDYTLVANFAPIVTLTISSGDGGSATTPGEGVFSYASGTDVEIEATADENYEFSGWSGTAVTAGKVADAMAASTTVAIDGDYTLVANFTRTYALDITSTDGGSVVAPGEGTFTYTSGTSAAVIASADDGQQFVGWTGTAVDAGMVADPNVTSTTVTMDDDYTLVANFLPLYTLDASSTDGGSVLTPGEGAFEYTLGTEVAVEAVADADYAFTGWTGTAVDAGAVADANAITTVTMDGDYTLVANFTPVYAVEISSTDGGAVTTPGEGTFDYNSGTSVDVVAEADPNYAFAGWTGTAVDANMVADVNEASTTLTVEGDYTLVANFLPIYTVEVSSGDGGSVTTPGEGTFDYTSGTDVEIVAEADTHYAFSGWTGTAVDEGMVADVNEASTTMTVEGDYTLVANFERAYALSISSTDGGSVTTPGEGDFTYSDVTDVNVVAVADPNYEFAGWSGTAVADGNVADASALSTTVNVDGTYTLVANFLPIYTLTVSSENGGSVSVPGEGDFDYVSGSEVTVTAAVDAKYRFTGWAGTAVDAGKVANVSATTTTVTVEGDYTLVATYSFVMHTIKVSSGSGGSVVTPGEGTFEYELGDVLTLKAEADEGYHFVNWSGSLYGATNPMAIEVKSDINVKANFEPDAPVLTTSATEGGQVILPGEGEFTYGYKEAISAIAIPDPGYMFAGWTGTQVDSGAVTDASSARVDFAIKVDGTLEAVFTPAVVTLYVDADAADPNEDGSADHPFDSIQEAIYAADAGYAVLVSPGTYNENISFLGKSISVSAADLCTPGAVSQTILAGADANSVVTFENGESSSAVLTGFTIVNGNAEQGAGIYCNGADPIITNCLIVGNVADVGAGVCCLESQAILTNCTIADNYSFVEGGGLYCDDSVTVINSIIYGNMPEEIVDASGALTLSYTNVDTDPLFVAPGYWALPSDLTVAVDPIEPDAVWVDGDYHLMSETGHWNGTEWEADAATSPSINAGLPTADQGCETDRINMGAFGGTAEASL